MSIPRPLHRVVRLTLTCSVLLAAVGCETVTPRTNQTKPVSGRVTVDGVPQPGRSVTLRRQDFTEVQVTTDAAGAYRADVDTGLWTITVAADDLDCPSVEVQILVQDSYTVDLACTRPRGGLIGTVEVDGVPTPGIEVQVQAGVGGVVYTGVTKASGDYRVDVPIGDYTVTVGAAPAVCQPAPGAATVSRDQDVTLDFECTTPTGTLTGIVSLNSVPVPSVEVVIYNEDLQPVATVVTDAMGRYSADLPAALYYVGTDIEGAICPSPFDDSVEVPAGGASGLDRACIGIEGLYDASLTETSNTCSTPNEPAFPVGLAFFGTGAGTPWDFLLAPGDRPADSWASIRCTPGPGMCGGRSPRFGDGSGFTFEELWSLTVVLGGPGAQALALSGTVDVELFFPQGGTCTRSFDVAGTGGGG